MEFKCKKCAECKNKETCEKKRMEHYGALSLGDNLYINTTRNLFVDNSIETKIFNHLVRNGKI